MRIDAVDPRDLDLDTADELAELRRSCLVGVDVAAYTGPALLLDIVEGSGEPEDQVVLLAREDDRLVGWARATEPRREYTDSLFLQGCVAPDHQGRGVGRALLDALTAGTTRTRLRTRAWEGTPGRPALTAWGFTASHTSAVRRLDLDAPDPGWSSMRREADAAADGYELVRRVGPTPEADLQEMVVLREAINDAPDALEFESYPTDRIAAYEQALTRRRQTQYTVVARHRGTGEPAGLSMVCVDEFDPSTAHQEDTSVVRAHRGHRLGLLLKLDMIAWLRHERPEVTGVETWNDSTNHHMIAVNERLGMREVARSTVFKRER
ncbi:GNAT family N-acetyltransferase [Nocardioides iriomotensis]|nr:GNAT family N-acetyltransferase [Nocardioides iriomotensis]